MSRIAMSKKPQQRAPGQPTLNFSQEGAFMGFSYTPPKNAVAKSATAGGGAACGGGTARGGSMARGGAAQACARVVCPALWRMLS